MPPAWPSAGTRVSPACSATSSGSASRSSSTRATPHFEQTNTLSGFIGEGTGGVTELLKRRVILPMAGPIAETDHVLGHELVHAFQFDITGRGAGPLSSGNMPSAIQLPLWFIEGMAEYLSIGPVDPHTAMWMRDAVAAEQDAAHRPARQPRIFPLPLRAGALVLRGRALGRRGRGARPAGFDARQHRRGKDPGRDHGRSLQGPVEAVARGAAGAVPPLHGGQAPAHDLRAGGDHGEERGRAQHRSRAQPGRLQPGLLLREGPVLDRPLPGRCAHRTDPAPADQDGQRPALPEPAVHQLGGQLRCDGAAVRVRGRRGRQGRLVAARFQWRQRAGLRGTRGGRDLRPELLPRRTPGGLLGHDGRLHRPLRLRPRGQARSAG